MAKKQKKKEKPAPPPVDTSQEHKHQPLAYAGEKDRFALQVSLFGIFVSLTFAYFVYFSHQIVEIQSNIQSKIIEINAINNPYPFQFITISGHEKYFYLERREILRNNFRALTDKLTAGEIPDQQLKELGKEIQKTITQTAYFFPYKKMIDFKKDGSSTFDPNIHESIDTKKPVNIPFLKQQVDEIYNWNYSFTFRLKDSKDQIAKAMIAAGGFQDEYTKSRVSKYLDSLINYLEEHYRLAIPLGLALKKYEYFLTKVTTWKVALLSALLLINFTTGILIPSFRKKSDYNTWLSVCSQATFIGGLLLLFSEALFSIPT